jgi:hypothetical protein
MLTDADGCWRMQGGVDISEHTHGKLEVRVLRADTLDYDLSRHQRVPADALDDDPSVLRMLTYADAVDIRCGCLQTR